ncbi:MAG: glycosyltransferase family protein [Cytophagales bacterium]|nr:glycosyltransferase family protein [Cytophagales bacterium]
MKIITIVQARTGSSRLPNKILYPLFDKPILYYMIERVMHSRHKGTVVIATSMEPADDVIEAWCKTQGWECFRGSLQDLLDRHYQAALHYHADVVLKIPSDCPLIDPNIIDEVIEYFINNKLDYAGNLHPATHPDGNDVEIMTIETLKNAWQNATRPLEREHTTPYIWENPQLFKIGNITWATGLDWSKSHRFTLDYYEDYLFIKAVYEALYPDYKIFNLQQILDLLKIKPQIYALNAKYAGEYWYKNHIGELKTINYVDQRTNQ